jgi:hypothetical protein
MTRSFGRWFICFGCWFRIESVKMLILVSARLVELLNFVLLFWAVCGSNLRFLGSKSMPETNELSGQLNWGKKISNLDDVKWQMTWQQHPKNFVEKYEVSDKICNFRQKQDFGLIETGSKVKRVFIRNFRWIIGIFVWFFRTECFGFKNPKFFITV